MTSIVWLSQDASRIDASKVDVTSATVLDATFNIPGDAPTGLWDVNVQQVDETVVTREDGFTILAAECTISDLGTGTQTACNAETNTYTQVVVVTYANPPPTGNLVVNGQTFAIGTSPQSVTLTNLVANGAAVNVTANFSAEAGCSRTENALFTAPASCAVSACAISDLGTGTQTACNAETNTYTQVVVVTFANPPTTGNLVVNGQTFAIGTSPQSVTLTNLVANGAAVNVTANFSAQTGCSRTENALFTAPASCAPVCSISDLETGTQTACSPATNTYTQVVVVTYSNPPTSGNLVVNGQTFTIGTSPQSVTLIDLVANGNAVNVTANFSAQTGCSRTENALFTAPVGCAPVCSISDLETGTQTPCNPATNTYTQVVVVTYTNPPTSGNLVVNGQTFTIGTSPQSVTLINLVANGNAVNVTANFSASTGCSRTENALFTAPVGCAPVCSISDLEPGAQTPCDPATNRYTQVVVVTFTNPPASGQLDVNGQPFAIGTSPQSVTLIGLLSDGAPVDVTANFTAVKGCDRTETALFTAPAACAAGIPPDCSDAEPSCDVLCSSNHRYKNVSIEDVEDPDGRDRNIEIAITAVTSDEPTNGSGDGNTCPDAVIRNDGTVDLRAERARGGNGRVYTIYFTATDETGLSCSDSVFVCVPRGGRDDDDDDDDDDDGRGILPGGASSEDQAGDLSGHRRRDRDRDRDRDRCGGRHDDDAGAILPGTSGNVPVDLSGGRHRDGGCGERDDDDAGAILPENSSGGVLADLSGGRRRDCVRDEVQYDATVCDPGKGSLSGPAASPIVTRVAGDQLAVQFANATAGLVDLRIYDLRGRLVRRLAAQEFPAGRHTLNWDGRDTNGHQTASGIYLVRVITSGESRTSKTLWMR